MNIEQVVLENIRTNEAEDFPFIRHDNGVRARVLAEIPAEIGYEEDMLLIETVPLAKNGCIDQRFDPAKRIVSKEYFDNNYW
jgi:hypothetical protein